MTAVAGIFPHPTLTSLAEKMGGRKMVRISIEDHVDIVSRPLEGGTKMYEGEGRCLIMVDE